MNDVESQKLKQEMLDEMQDEMMDNLYGKKAKRRRTFLKLSCYRIYLIRVLVISFFVLFVYLSFKILVASPGYTDLETEKNALKLDRLIDEKANEFIPLFHQALDLLKKHPKYYKKVVNNIHDIQISNKMCPYACIYSRGTMIYGTLNFIKESIFPEANFDKKILFINPRMPEYSKNPSDFASMLVHETDHVQYLESSKLRRAALFIKCNPILNPHISVYSRLSDISHRIKTIEICAEKEQIAFHEASKTPSHYSDENIFVLIFKFVGGFFKSAFHIIKSLFI